MQLRRKLLALCLPGCALNPAFVSGAGGVSGQFPRHQLWVRVVINPGADDASMAELNHSAKRKPADLCPDAHAVLAGVCPAGGSRLSLGTATEPALSVDGVGSRIAILLALPSETGVEGNADQRRANRNSSCTW